MGYFVVSSSRFRKIAYVYQFVALQNAMGDES
jgi:hypothetical protein